MRGRWPVGLSRSLPTSVWLSDSVPGRSPPAKAWLDRGAHHFLKLRLPAVNTITWLSTALENWTVSAFEK